MMSLHEECVLCVFVEFVFLSACLSIILLHMLLDKF